jgi:hypothetical protein
MGCLVPAFNTAFYKKPVWAALEDGVVDILKKFDVDNGP